MARTLVIFDLDDTLIQSGEIDSDCFREAFAVAFGLRDLDADWTRFAEVTDAGISREALRGAFGGDGLAERVEVHRRVFLDLLRDRIDREGGALKEVPGARRILEVLTESPNSRPAIATGSWEDSAKAKLRWAGLDALALPLASSDDGVSRESIVRAAIREATRQSDGAEFDRIVAVGDGAWDVTTAAALGLAFVGIGRESGRERLLSAGADVVLEDYRDIDQVFAALSSASAIR